LALRTMAWHLRAEPAVMALVHLDVG
jgi:hypothetical protein